MLQGGGLLLQPNIPAAYAWLGASSADALSRLLRSTEHRPSPAPTNLQHGDAFTLRLAGQRMTFLFAPAALQRYFTAPDSELTFAPAVQQVLGAVGVVVVGCYPGQCSGKGAFQPSAQPSVR